MNFSMLWLQLQLILLKEQDLIDIKVRMRMQDLENAMLLTFIFFHKKLAENVAKVHKYGQKYSEKHHHL